MEQPANAFSDPLHAQVGALRYLVLMMLQRLDADGYASIAEITAGVKGDRAHLDPGLPDHALIDATFRETLAILELAAHKH
ncbi:hypothetical protein [Herbaspirillum robiniae]|uniref:Uncharacterized protein n=1 Tax=Herbaspirillum robiniae TaxID=2014887 RepID=A0A2D0B5C2_9BURK|nr:hypothetical protein [Herbaspirillum robiniae]OWY26721.1 hypothetical protein CEJ42_22580 [Herbaspirillum robiniae]